MAQRTRIGIIDYGSGNVRSVVNAVEHLGCDVIVSREEPRLAECERIILPGVGSFRVAMERLRDLGLVPVLESLVFEQRKPYLGICIGMQILATTGEEFGEHAGLGWIRGTTRKLDVSSSGLPLPHVGWNDVTSEAFPLVRDAEPRPAFYFVHSYVLEIDEAVTSAAYCVYGVRFLAAVQKDNIWGVQFHPEKSQAEGLGVLRQFCGLHE